MQLKAKTNFTASILNTKSRRGVVLVEVALVEGGAVDPFVAVFAQEAVEAHEDAFEAVFLDGLKHVLGAGGAEVAAGAVDGRDDGLVEADDFFDGPGKWGAWGRR